MGGASTKPMAPPSPVVAAAPSAGVNLYGVNRYLPPERVEQQAYSEEELKDLFGRYKEGEMEPGSTTRRMLQGVLKQIDKLVTEKKERDVWRAELYDLFQWERGRYVSRYSPPEFVCPPQMWKAAMFMLDRLFPQGHSAEKQIHQILNPSEQCNPSAPHPTGKPANPA